MNALALIGTGFNAASQADFIGKTNWLESTWIPNVGDRDVIIVDNSEPPLPKLFGIGKKIRIIEVMANLGHVEQMLGKFEPRLCGWSLSWILPALIAYSEGRDFIYIEADCLVFGEWEKQLYADMEAGGLLMAFGAPSPFAVVEQSLFLIKHSFILDAISAYTAIRRPDPQCLPEAKFWIMYQTTPQIGFHTVGPGRNRPLALDAAAWSAQKFQPEELTQMRELKLI